MYHNFFLTMSSMWRVGETTGCVCLQSAGKKHQRKSCFFFFFFSWLARGFFALSAHARAVLAGWAVDEGRLAGLGSSKLGAIAV